MNLSFREFLMPYMNLIIQEIYNSGNLSFRGFPTLYGLHLIQGISHSGNLSFRGFPPPIINLSFREFIFQGIQGISHPLRAGNFSSPLWGNFSSPPGREFPYPKSISDSGNFSTLSPNFWFREFLLPYMNLSFREFPLSYINFWFREFLIPSGQGISPYPISIYHSGNLSFRKLTIQRIYHSVNLSFSEFIIQGIYHSGNLSFREFIIQGIYHSGNLSFRKFIIQGIYQIQTGNFTIHGNLSFMEFIILWIYHSCEFIIQWNLSFREFIIQGIYHSGNLSFRGFLIQGISLPYMNFSIPLGCLAGESGVPHSGTLPSPPGRKLILPIMNFWIQGISDSGNFWFREFNLNIQGISDLGNFWFREFLDPREFLIQGISGFREFLIRGNFWFRGFSHPSGGGWNFSSLRGLQGRREFLISYMNQKFLNQKLASPGGPGGMRNSCLPWRPRRDRTLPPMEAPEGEEIPWMRNSLNEKFIWIRRRKSLPEGWEIPCPEGMRNSLPGGIRNL